MDHLLTQEELLLEELDVMKAFTKVFNSNLTLGLALGYIVLNLGNQ